MQNNDRNALCETSFQANTGVHPAAFISHQVFLKSFCRSQLPHKSVRLSFTITDIKNKLMDLCGN